MKILQIIPSFGLGGAEIMCENLIYSLSKMGNEVSIISLFDYRSPITKRLEENGYHIIYLNKKSGVDFSIISKIAYELKRENPDIIHMHIDTAKYVWMAVKKAKIKSKLIYTVHNMADKDSFGISRKINFCLFKFRKILPVALSGIVQESISSVYKLNKQSIPIIYNGIDLDKCNAKTTYEFDGDIKILHIGRFAEQKNHKGLLEAFVQVHNAYPNSILQLIGDGELRKSMEEYAKVLKIDESVQFLGLKADVHSFLSQADIFVLPSTYEGIPITIIEAMASGLPIVATAVGGVPNMLLDKSEALLVECNPLSIANACINFIKDEQLRRHCGQNALTASKNFSADYMAGEYCKIYETLMYNDIK